mgnify:CR=1 FL=1
MTAARVRTFVTHIGTDARTDYSADRTAYHRARNRAGRRADGGGLCFPVGVCDVVLVWYWWSFALGRMWRQSRSTTRRRT